MRILWAVVIVGCSSTETATPRDAGSPPPPDATVEDDAAVDDAGTPIPCTEAQAGFATGAKCDGGYVYSVYGGTCPAGEMGACTVLKADSIGNYAEACCEKLACARAEAPTTLQCARKYDSGSRRGWICPKGQKPPGTCEPLNGDDYCCVE